MAENELKQLIFQVVETILREERLLNEVKELHSRGLISDIRRDELIRHYEIRLKSHLGYYNRLIKNIGVKND